MKPTLFGPPAGDLRLGHLPKVLAVDDHLALGGAVEPGDQVQQGRLARARGAHQGQEFSLLDLNVEIHEHGNHELVAAILFRHAFEDDRMRIGHRPGASIGALGGGDSAR